MLNEIDLSRVDLNLLVLFESVLAARHVGRAAARLSLSPSAVSHGLGRLRRLLNDPLFLRTPRGVVPTARATALAGPIADVLARVRRVVATAEPFDPARSTRRFVLGAPDGISAVFLPPLLDHLRRAAPGIDIGVRQLLPPDARRPIGNAWAPVLDTLEARAVDIAVLPVAAVPPRFAAQPLYDEMFVIAMRAGHPFARDPGLARYCAQHHLVVSQSADVHAFIDAVLGRQGLQRHVAVTVPNFMMALATVADTDLLAAVPRRFAALHAARFGVVVAEAPVRLPRFRLRAIVPKVALMDDGLAWLFAVLRQLFREA